MGCPECYKNSTFLKEIVRPSLSILRDVFDNLQLETQNDKSKRGKPLTGTFFKWRKSIENTDDISEKIWNAQTHQRLSLLMILNMMIQ